MWIEGRVTDQHTGKGLSGWVEYYVTNDNPDYAFARTLRVDQRDRWQSGDDGRYRIAALPGPGIVTFRAHQDQDYPRTDTIVRLDGTREKVSGAMRNTEPHHIFPANYHLVIEVNPDAAAQHMELNVQLDGGTTVVGRVVDPDDQPVTGYYYAGRSAEFPSWMWANQDKFELVGYDPESPRHVYFCDHQRNLAGSAIVSGEVPEKLVVKLQPAGQVKGRLVDADGTPLGNCQLVPWSPPLSDPSQARPYSAAPLPRNLDHNLSGRYETDKDGRFEISCLAPGVEYRVRAFDRDRMTPTRGRMPKVSGPLDVVIKVDPGESKDLGDVRLADESKFTLPMGNAVPAPIGDTNASSAKPADADPAVGNADGKGRPVATGRVVDADGKPVAGAEILFASGVQGGTGAVVCAHDDRR